MLKLDKEQVVAYVQIAMLLSHVSCAEHFCHRVLGLIPTALVSLKGLLFKIILLPACSYGK